MAPLAAKPVTAEMVDVPQPAKQFPVMNLIHIMREKQRERRVIRPDSFRRRFHYRSLATGLPPIPDALYVVIVVGRNEFGWAINACPPAVLRWEMRCIPSYQRNGRRQRHFEKRGIIQIGDLGYVCG